MGRVTTVPLALGVLAVFGCQETIAPGGTAPDFAIQDATHGDGTAHFYWSTPIVSVPGQGGIFDPTYQPLVQVCEWDGSACGAVVAEFRTGKGSGDVIKVDVEGERYHVNWHTGQCTSGSCALNPTKNYRIRVLVAGLEAGFANVDLLSRRAEARNINTAQFVAVVNGTTLPIRFRLEHGLTLVNAHATALPRLLRASQRYRDAGVKLASGHDGSAVVEGRALLGADGTTLIELTTGHLDRPGTAPGNIEKVQFKQLNASGEAVYTLNFNGLAGGGVWSHAFTGFPRRVGLQLQASITGIDPSRTSVVTVPITVARRPDLEAKNLALPTTAAPGVPTVITATVAEKNGDVGATADCRLYVNGTLADEAPAIWVDAGDEVSCQFAHSFLQPGSHTVRVAIENVTPGDDDATNNEVTGSLAVVASNYTNVFNDATADLEEHHQVRATWKFSQQVTRIDDPSFVLETYDEESLTEKDGRKLSSQHQWVSTEAVGNEIAFPLASVRVLQRSGDAVVADYTLTNMHATYTESWGWEEPWERVWGHTSCAESPAPAGQAGFVSVCTTARNAQATGQPVRSATQTWAFAKATGGRVQYFSRYFYRYIHIRDGLDYGDEALWLEDEIHGGAIGQPGAEMSWVLDVEGVHAGTGEPLVYTAHLSEPWQTLTSYDFDGTEQCTASSFTWDAFLTAFHYCSAEFGSLRWMQARKHLSP